MEGVSIIDITNPETPAYIFMDYPAVVEDARRYVEGYYKIDRQLDGECRWFLPTPCCHLS